jgi:hypothetical protein
MTHMAMSTVLSTCARIQAGFVVEVGCTWEGDARARIASIPSAVATDDDIAAPISVNAAAASAMAAYHESLDDPKAAVRGSAKSKDSSESAWSYRGAWGLEPDSDGEARSSGFYSDGADLDDSVSEFDSESEEADRPWLSVSSRSARAGVSAADKPVFNSKSGTWSFPASSKRAKSNVFVEEVEATLAKLKEKYPGASQPPFITFGS